MQGTLEYGELISIREGKHQINRQAIDTPVHYTARNVRENSQLGKCLQCCEEITYQRENVYSVVKKSHIRGKMSAV